MTKLYENYQRMAMITYANEMADACIPHGVDPSEVCSAAATKPFGYAPFAPSLGVVGHCIPINLYYLLSDSTFPLLQAATEKIWQRLAMLAQRDRETLSHRKRKVSGAEKPSVLVASVGFKAGQATLSTSPGLELAKGLELSGSVDVSFADRLVPRSAIPQIPRLDDENWTKETLETYDMIVIAFRQVRMDFGVLSDLQDVLVELWCR
jgi:UDP-N-acetyl-D-mannosaminuronate dehydrogenase